MMVPLILLALAESTSSLSTSRAYHFVNMEKTWSEAQAYCREHFLDLATMETQEDWARVREVVEVEGQLVWMGLYDDANDWRWSMGGAPLNNAAIASLLPASKSHKSERHCVSWREDTVHDCECDSAFYSVCYDERSSSYIPVDVPMTWESAQQHCREAHTDLASIRDEQEKGMVSNVADPQFHWWIGLSRGPRKWSDGSSSSLRLWDGGQPAGDYDHCGCFFLSGWHDCGCSWKLPFICSVPIRSVLKLQLLTDGSVDVNEAPIRDGIEMQIGNHLRDWGIRKESKVKWKKGPN